MNPPFSQDMAPQPDSAEEIPPQQEPQPEVLSAEAEAPAGPAPEPQPESKAPVEATAEAAEPEPEAPRPRRKPRGNPKITAKNFVLKDRARALKVTDVRKFIEALKASPEGPEAEKSGRVRLVLLSSMQVRLRGFASCAWHLTRLATSLPGQSQPSKSGPHSATHWMQRVLTEFWMRAGRVLPGGTQPRADS